MKKFPKDLLDALIAGDAVGLVGSGPSISAGLPNWHDLLDLMIRECEEHVIGFQEGKELRQLLENGMFLLVADECRHRLGTSLYRDFIQGVFRPESISPSPLQKLICKLPLSAILTTNYDCLLEQAYSENADHSGIPPIYTHKNIAQLARLATEKRFFILKIHGHIDDIENIILTEKDYQDIIHQSPAFKTAISNICANKTLIIIGYGLRDPDLNLILGEYATIFKGFGRRHFTFVENPGTILPKFFSENYNITVIPYESTCDHSAGLYEILSTLLAQANRHVSMITGKSPSGDVKSPRHPYKFLDYYDFEDKDIFFGRENDSRALMQLVISHRVVILFGLSGVGKTSLIKASIIPKIYGTKYVPIYFRPTSSDMRFIIDKNGNMTDASFDANPLEGKVAAHALLLEMNKIGKVPIIFLDQFEQVFMDLERDKFNKITEFLNTLIDHQQLQCHIVISIREDYFARLNDLASSIPSIFNNRFQLKKLDVASARDAIKKPAELVDIYREDDYLQAVLNDLDRDGIEPPQLQIVCTAVFNALPLGWKTLDKNIYKQLGGAESILSGYIGYVLSSFRDGDRDVAREILKCCVSPSLSRILLSLDNIVEILGTKYNKDHIIMVLDTLVFQRLIRSLKTESDFTYELSHEYLIPQIDQWISDEEREIKMIREVMDRERLICKHLNTMIPLERAYYLKSHCDEANLNPSDRELIERSIKEGEKQQHEKKSSDELLTHAQKMEAIGTLTGGIAHDFNNLLMGMQGYVSLSLTDVDQKSVIYERLTVIEQIIRSGAELTKQLLDFSRRGKHEVEVANLNEIVDKTATMFGRTKKEISIHRKYEKDLWTVYVNRNQIEQVLLNLYVNAWQAMPGGGDLLLETRNEILDENYVKSYELKPGPYVKLIVSDTGIGMDESTKKRIFEPFFTTKEMGRGTGLGLASVYGIIL